MIIDDFRDEYAFLSNFYPVEVTYDGTVCPTLEHAYQCAKAVTMEDREFIASQTTAGKAKRAGAALVNLRPDWDTVKCGIMYDLLNQKFADPILHDLLNATGNAELIEGNSWGDTFWGVCRGEGQNKLGNMLMAVRGRTGCGSSLIFIEG